MHRRFDTLEDGVHFIYRSLVRNLPHIKGIRGDVRLRHPELTRQLLDRTGAPDLGLPVVLVTGSKGKGSTSLLTAALLQGAGKRVGLFTGPDLVHYTERIRVDGEAIEEGDFLRLLGSLAGEIEALDAIQPPGHYLSPVGTALVVALHYFRQAGVDCVVLECGRGGLMDDANQVPHGWAVITPVMTEHVAELGPTLLDIAAHKAGIIQPGVKVVCSAAQYPEVETVLRQKAVQCGAELRVYGRQFGAGAVELLPDRVRAEIWTSLQPGTPVELKLSGAFQAQNAALAWATAEAVLGGLDAARAQATLQAVSFPGRCHVLDRAPLTLVDGAIHRDAAVHVADYLRRFGQGTVAAVVAVPEDKDYAGVLETLAPVADHLVVTRAHNPHLRFTSDALEVARRLNAAAREAPSLEEALELARARVGAGGTIAIVGTQSLVGDALRLWGHDFRRLWGPLPPSYPPPQSSPI